MAVWKRTLYVVAGVDDLINFARAHPGAGGGFDWFLGAQLTFNDEDLKSLLLLAAGGDRRHLEIARPGRHGWASGAAGRPWAQGATSAMLDNLSRPSIVTHSLGGWLGVAKPKMQL